MIKRIAIIAVMGLLIYSCGQVKEQQTETAEMSLISELVSEPLGFEGKEVKFEGMISHICKHSGDKMRVNQVNDDDFSILVMLKDFQTQFSPEFEGKHVMLSGVLKTEVRNLEAADHDHDHAHDGEEDHACSSTEEAVKRLQEKGITPDIRAYIEMSSFEIIEDQPEETEETVDVAEATKSDSGC
jgi:hypothetical protein